MQKLMAFLYLLGCLLTSFAQERELPATGNEQLIENAVENKEETETDDTFLQEMDQFLEHPVNLNTADENMLAQLYILHPVQIQNLIGYRRLLGALVSLYEIQAVPGWDPELIRKLRPYITVENDLNIISGLRKRLRDGEHTLLIRASQVLEKSKGYGMDQPGSIDHYPGSMQRYVLRYKYNYKNLLQFGILAEKDPGEQFFKGKQKIGFDFYSGHIFIRNMGIVKAIAIGDFTVNMSQGLIQWQGMAFKKGTGIMMVKRQSPVLKPYQSAGEYNFHRGLGITLGKEKWEATVFASYRNLDANFVAADSITGSGFISSFQTSGYHRTKSETEDKAVQHQLAVGGNIAFNPGRLHLGVNAIQYRFAFPLYKDTYPYNLYAMKGKNAGNYSFDYGFTYKNVHFFGELAFNNSFRPAFVSGLMISVSANADMCFLYRNISPGYQSLNANAFTENTNPANEQGLFSGISIRPVQGWQVDAYVDLFKFPWLRYGVNAPSSGAEYLVQLSFRPNRQLEIYSRYKRGAGASNVDVADAVIDPIGTVSRQNWRTQFSYKVNQHITIRCRTELSWVNKRQPGASEGVLLFADVLYKPVLKPYAAGLRLQFFQADDYSSRIYAYENDVLFSSSIPAFYEKGYRYYLNASYNISRKLTLWVKAAQTVYPGRKTLGSGLDEINGNRKTEVKLQLMYRF